ncbi:MAG: cache domain-containing protein, partial [Bacteroidales bacterium]|nr:cache domain-containing protein [Bacteroidales bacterium]
KIKLANMSIRLKLTIGLITIILISNIVLAVITSMYVRSVYFEEVQTRVRMDLNSARDIYNNSVNQIEQVLKAVSYRRRISLPLEKEVKGDLGKVLQNIYDDSGIDMLTLVGTDGRVIYRAHNPEQYGDDVSEISIIKKVLDEGRSAKGTMVISHELLKIECEELSSQAIIKIEDTLKARQVSKKIENRGFIIAAAVPFVSFDNENNEKILGLLLGGYLINNNFEIVDKIKSQVFQDQSYKGEDIGTATIFFNDLRISTNVKNKDNQRAVGSRMSTEVYDHVINKGKVWDDRAFVVKNWHITAYEPIRDPNNKIIGSLYVGLLEEPFKKPQKIIIVFFIIMISLSAFAGLVLMFFYTRKLLKPMDNIMTMSKKIITGDLTARCNIHSSGEMGILCKTINSMAEAIEQREKELQRVTQQQISQSEKLASIGRLSAGIAHEINNPLTGILTFAHLLKQKKSNNEEDIKDVDVIVRETTRIRDIVRGLLDFARQTPFEKEFLDINEILHQILNLFKSQKEFGKIVIEDNYSENIPNYYGDKNQLQQVFLNIILNAGEAISNNGTITIDTSIEDNMIVIAIKDNGCGIKKENLDMIFDPFYTTKPVGKGTGLGLSISHGIVEQHAGYIKCESEEGIGTTFSIFLPIKNDKMIE